MRSHVFGMIRRSLSCIIGLDGIAILIGSPATRSRTGSSASDSPKR
jgi:hypothetical protein